MLGARAASFACHVTQPQPVVVTLCLCRGGILPFYPASGRAATQLPPAAAAAASGWYARYVPDEGDRRDAEVLAGDPAGEFLLRSRTPWLVRGVAYACMRGGGGGGEGGGVGVGARAAARVGEGGHGGQAGGLTQRWW